MARPHRPSASSDSSSDSPGTAAPPAPPEPPPSPAASGAPPEPLPPASVALLATYAVLFGNVTTEKTNIEPNALVTKEAKLLALLTPEPAEVDPSAPDELPGHRRAAQERLADVRAAMAKKPFAQHGGRRYARGTKGIVKLGAKVFQSVRQRGDELLVLNTDGPLCFALGKGSDVTIKTPSSLRAGLVSQRAALTAEENQPRLQEARFRPERCVARIDRVLPGLDAAIAAGTFGETTKGEANTELRQALVKFDIVRAHARAFLEDFVSEAAAEAFDAEIPHLHPGAADEAPPPPPAPQSGAPAANAPNTPATP